MVGFFGLIFGPAGASGSVAGAAVAAAAGGAGDAAGGAAGVGVSGVASVIRFAPVQLRSRRQQLRQRFNTEEKRRTQRKTAPSSVLSFPLSPILPLPPLLPCLAAASNSVAAENYAAG